MRRNAAWNIAEVVFTTLTQLIIFRMIIASLGLSALGIWSLVFSTLAFARIADVGMAGTLVRFIARPSSGDARCIAPMTYVDTAVVTNTAIYTVLGAILYAPAYYALGWAVHGANLETARALLPYAAASFVILNVASVITSALIGFNRSDLKSIFALLGLGAQLLIATVAIRRYGLAGLAWAQISQNLLLIVAGWFSILAIGGSGTFWRLPARLSMTAFKEMLAFGVKLQVLNISNFLYEPLTKFVFSAVAGPAALGTFDIVYRVVGQARAIIVAPSQNLTPLFAAMESDNIAARQKLYDIATASIILAWIVGGFTITVVSPALSMIFLRRLDPAFVATALVLCAGWSFNIASTPAYLSGIARGVVRWNVAGSAASTLLSPLLVFALGTGFGSVGVAVGSSAAVAIGGVVMILGNTKDAGFDRALPQTDEYRWILASAMRRVFGRFTGHVDAGIGDSTSGKAT